MWGNGCFHVLTLKGWKSLWPIQIWLVKNFLYKHFKRQFTRFYHRKLNWKLYLQLQSKFSDFAALRVRFSPMENSDWTTWGLFHFLLFKKWNEPTFNRIYFHIIKFTKSCDKFYLHKQKIPKKRNYTAVVWCFLVTKCTSNGNFLISFLKVSCQCQQDYIVCIFHTQFSLHEIL